MSCSPSIEKRTHRRRQRAASKCKARPVLSLKMAENTGNLLQGWVLMCFCLSWAALNKSIDLSSCPYTHNFSTQETSHSTAGMQGRLSHPWPGCDGQNVFQPLLHQPPSHTPDLFLPSSQWQIAHMMLPMVPSPRFKSSPPPLDPQCNTTTRSKGPAHPCLIPSPCRLIPLSAVHN